MDLDHATRLKRLRFRAWHRGTKEADLMIGGFCDAHCEGWTPAEVEHFEALMEEQDVDIMAWAMGTLPTPDRWNTPMMQAMRRLNFVPLPSSLSPSGERASERSEALERGRA